MDLDLLAFFMALRFSNSAYPEIGDGNFRCALWSFQQQIVLKCEHFVPFVLSYKRLCTVFRITVR